MPFLGTTGGGSVKQYGGQANLGYFIKNSLRFQSTGYLTKTLTTPTNNKIYTWSSWVKRGDLGGLENNIFSCRPTSSPYGFLTFRNTGSPTPNALNYADSVNGGTLITTQVFRDPSAWYHIVLAVDTTQATSSNRVKLYVNGTQITSFSTATYPTLNAANNINTASAHCIGNEVPNGTSEPLNGYLAEVNFIDGLQLTPSSFGKTDAVTGQWIPKKFASTYGTNGFYLKFADASAATAAAIGKDSSGNANNWTPNNISVTAGATYDAMIDSPSLSAFASNYPTLNPLDMGSPSEPMSAGNLNINGGNNIRATMACPSTGKWYFEYTRTNTTDYAHAGIFATSATITLLTGGSQIYRSDGQLFENNSSILSSWASYTTNDVIGVAVNCDTSQVSWYKNNTLVGTRSLVSEMTSSSPIFGVRNNTGATASVNFGQRPFAYTPPTGFKSLNTFNLP